MTKPDTPSEMPEGPPKGKKESLLKATEPAQEFFRAWTFNDADKDGPWAWRDITEKDLKDVIEKLANFETMSTNELEKPPPSRQKSHLIPIEDLSRKAQIRLKNIKGSQWIDDSDGIFSFRIGSRKRLFCVPITQRIDEQTLYLYQVLWWDPKHEVCPSNKKNS